MFIYKITLKAHRGKENFNLADLESFKPVKMFLNKFAIGSHSQLSINKLSINLVPFPAPRHCF